MRIAAISDLDTLGMDMEPFFDMVKKVSKPDVLLLAGDIYEYRSPEIYALILDFLEMVKWDCPIVAVFGNREFEEDRDEIRKYCKDRIIFLEESAVEFEIEGKKVLVVGTEGSLEVPTWWQFTHNEGINKVYDKRVETVRKLLAKDADVKILLSHYAPTYKTLKGEDKRIYGGLGTENYEKVLEQTNTDIAVHGHAHYGIPLAMVGKTTVFNVCFTINKKLVEIDPDNLPKADIEKFSK